MLTLKFDEYNETLVRCLANFLMEYSTASRDGYNDMPVPEEATPEEPTQESNDPAPATVSPEPEPEPEPKTDHKNVLFDPEYCAKAKDPFYPKGERAGQWKKKRGVSDDTYNSWYANRLECLPADLQPEAEPIQTAAAFAPGEAQGTPVENIPTDAGQFMLWVSERQAAGTLVQADIETAYATAGLVVTDLFGGTETQIQANIATLYGLLNK